jgi:hypothetical protein
MVDTQLQHIVMAITEFTPAHTDNKNKQSELDFAWLLGFRYHEVSVGSHLYPQDSEKAYCDEAVLFSDVVPNEG